MTEINPEKWKQYHQLTVDEAMNLISGFEPGTYRFCGAKESEMPPHAIPIYRAMVRDFKEFKITMHISGEQVDWDSICKLVHPDEFYNPYSVWWATALLQVVDIKSWLRSNHFKSDFFDTDSTHIPFYLDCTIEDGFSPKLAAAVKVWEYFYHDPANLAPGKVLKKEMVKWLTERASELNLLYNDEPNKQGIEEVAKVANWRPEGGAPKL